MPARLQFDLTSLRLFVATAELGGISKASERMALAPAAASRRIQELEQQFGLPLFERRPSGMVLTDAGRALLAHARAILHTAGRMQDDAAAWRGGEQGVVRIAACKSVVLQFLPADIQRCAAACPGVRIDLQEMNSQGVLNAMSRGAADLGLYEATMGPVALPSRPYRDDRLVLLAPAGHALAARAGAGVGLEDILQFDVIALNPGSAISLAMERAAAELNRTLHMRIRVDSFDSMAAMVEAGVGLGVMPRAVAERNHGDARFARIAITEPWAERRFMLCEQPADALSTAARSISQVLAGA
jgi:DNA-binding transcriptional LysR family regulator